MELATADGGGPPCVAAAAAGERVAAVAAAGQRLAFAKTMLGGWDTGGGAGGSDGPVPHHNGSVLGCRLVLTKFLAWLTQAVGAGRGEDRRGSLKRNRPATEDLAPDLLEKIVDEGASVHPPSRDTLSLALIDFTAQSLALIDFTAQLSLALIDFTAQPDGRLNRLRSL